jgi:hypothetical protein
VERLQSIDLGTQHPESLRRIQQLEALRPIVPTDITPDITNPIFTRPLSGPTEILKESQSVHMDCMLQPINDPNLKIEWYFPLVSTF